MVGSTTSRREALYAGAKLAGGLMIAGALLPDKLTAQAKGEVLFDFEGGLVGWQLVRGETPRVARVQDSLCLSTFNPTNGGGATCVIHSPPFRVPDGTLSFGLAGSRQRDGKGQPESFVGLLVGEAIVLAASGAGDTTLRPVTWDVTRWAGNEARLIVTDGSRLGRAPYLVLSGPIVVSRISDGAAHAESVTDRRTSARYEIVYTIDPAREKYQTRLRPNVRVPLPWTGKPYQSCTWAVDGAATHRLEEFDDGNRAVLVTPHDMRSFRLRVRLQVVTCSYESAARQVRPEAPVPNNLQAYLRPNSFVNSDSVSICTLAERLKKQTPFDTIRSVLDWCNMWQRAYRGGPAPPDSGGSASQVLARGFGHCEGSTTLVLALLRACHIPCRFIRGIGAFGGVGGHGTQHSWTELYMPGIGWLPWDFGMAPFRYTRGLVCMFHYNRGTAGNNPDVHPETTDMWMIQRLGLDNSFLEYRLVDGAP